MNYILEHQNTFSPLGIRFWDPLLNEQIRDSLKVTVRPESNNRPKSTAYRTRSDIYTFSHIPGLLDIEYRDSSSPAAISSPGSKPFIVEIEDLRKRFVDTTVKVDLPLSYPGTYLSNTVGSPAGDSSSGFYLFSSCTRKVPKTIARLYANLKDYDSGNSVSHALMQIDAEDGQRWYGLSDINGRIAVYMHYPELVNGFSESPFVATNNKPWFERTWDFNVRVYYEPQVLNEVIGTKIPAYKSIMQQQQGTIWEPINDEEIVSPALFESSVVTVNMKYGKDLVLKTAGTSELLISPAIVSP